MSAEQAWIALLVACLIACIVGWFNASNKASGVANEFKTYKERRELCDKLALDLRRKK